SPATGTRRPRVGGHRAAGAGGSRVGRRGDGGGGGGLVHLPAGPEGGADAFPERQRVRVPVQAAEARDERVRGQEQSEEEHGWT
ncbi:hypothetical protein THAOC_08446, partial [Thalassiosira oceanica]